MQTINYFSMFSGIGGFELGLEAAGKLTGTNFNCIGYSEIEPHAIEIYERHYPNHVNYGDATSIDPHSLPDFALLVAGFPCQSFSIAGKRGGFEDTRGTLFFDIARILEHHKPKNFILENVKGLLSHDDGRTIRTIINTLTELGYCVEWQILNSKNHGVPHSRERIYIVGHLGGEPESPVFPFTRASGLNLREVTQGVADAHRIYEPTLARTLKAMGGGLGALTGLYVDRGQVRTLTPIETERLQGFPDDWTFGTDTSRKRRCGNAVTVNVVRDVATRLFDLDAPTTNCGTPGCDDWTNPTESETTE